MNFLTGVTNLNSMMKMTQMNMKWTERKNNPNKRQNKTEQQESPEIKRLREMAEDARRSNYVGGLKSKLKCGGSLTKDEMEYLKINHPELYQDAVENAAEREQYKRELENCRTQEDVDRLNMGRLNRFVSQAKTVSANPNIPLAKKVQILEKIMGKAMGLQADFNDFVKRGAYDSLPSELDEDDKKKADRKETPKLEQGENTDFVKESVSEIEGELDKLTKGEQTGDTPDTPQTTTPGDTPAPETKAPVTTSQRKVALDSYAAPASAAAPAAPTASPRLPTHV